MCEHRAAGDARSTVPAEEEDKIERQNAEIAAELQEAQQRSDERIAQIVSDTVESPIAGTEPGPGESTVAGESMQQVHENLE